MRRQIRRDSAIGEIKADARLRITTLKIPDRLLEKLAEMVVGDETHFPYPFWRMP